MPDPKVKELADGFDLKQRILEMLQKRELSNREYHLHQAGFMGGSNLYPCGHAQALEFANMPKPKLTGRRAYKGAMWVGSIDHDLLEDMLEEEFMNSPDPGFIVDTEVYPEPYEIIPGWRVESPVDVAMITPPGAEKTEHKFKNKILIIKTVGAGSGTEWIKIFDIKTVTDMGFWQKEIKPLGAKYKAQMHGYMKATGLKECTIIWYNKDTADVITTVVEWDQLFWNHVVERLERFKKLGLALSVDEHVSWRPADLLACDEEESYRCTYCAHADVKVIQEKGKKPLLELVKPCDPAVSIIRTRALDKFHVGTKWYRGRSIVSILEIKDETITAINQTNLKLKSKNEEYKVYSDSLFYADAQYSEWTDPKAKK